MKGGSIQLSDSKDFYKALKRYRGSEVTLRTRTGDTLVGVLRNVTKDGLAEIYQEEMLSPFMSDYLTFIRILDIESCIAEIIPDESSDD